jgi:hypothetical protein
MPPAMELLMGMSLSTSSSQSKRKACSGAKGVFQGVKCLPSKCEPLNLNPSTPQKSSLFICTLSSNGFLPPSPHTGD